MYENYLIHYGTLGMRWGRRKKQAGLDIDMTTGKISVDKTNAAISLGIEAAKISVTGRARDFMYSKVGRG